MAKVGNKTTIWHPELSNIHESAEIGDECVIHSHVWIGEGVKIGNRVRIQAFTFIPEGVEIGDDVFIGPRVTFTNDPLLSCSGRGSWKKTKVESGAKIGASVTLIAGVTVGAGAVIGAGSLITKNVPAFRLVYGSPASVIRPTGGAEREDGYPVSLMDPIDFEC